MTPTDTAIIDQVRADERAVLRRRMRLGFGLVVIATPALLPLDWVVHRAVFWELYAWKGAQMAVALGILWVTHNPRRFADYVPIALIGIAGMWVTTAGAAVVSADALTAALLGAVMPAGTAILLPWGARAQAVMVAFSGIGVLAVIVLVHGTVPPPFWYPTGAVAILFVVTIAVAHQSALNREDGARREAARVRAEAERTHEAAISAALAGIGRELIATASTPDLLERLSELVGRALDCDFVHTWVWRQPEDVFEPVSLWGEAPEQWEALRVVRVPSHLTAPLLAALQTEDVVAIDTAAPTPVVNPQFVAAAAESGVTHGLHVALRRGGEVIGVLNAGYRRQRRFDERQLRLARGIAHLVGLALENARLVEELEQHSRVKSDFVATISHELRSPLNVIVGYADMLQAGAMGELDDAQLDVVRKIEGRANELLDLIRSTLEVTRIDSGGEGLHAARVDPAELVRGLAAEMRELHTNEAVALEWEVPTGLPALETDGVKLKVVLANIVGNALKYTERGQVTVSAAPAVQGVRFSVRDTGIGIPPEAQQRIFEAFEREGAERVGHPGGIGLGLYIVQRLLALLGGRIELESEVGVGSTFTVWVPLVPPAAGREATA